MHDLNLAYVAGALGAISVIILFFRRLLVVLVAPVRWLLRQDRAAKDISRILSEVLPNGGGSLRDAVTRIEARGNLNEQITRAMLSDALHGVFQSDPQGRCVWVNAAYCRMVGHLPEDVEGDGWESYIHIEDREAVLTEWHRCVQGKREFQMTYRFNSGLKVHTIGHPLRDAGGKLLGYQGSVRVECPQPERPAVTPEN